MVELAIVITIVGVLAAIAAPQLMPAILMTRLEGGARHVAGFGRAATAYAALMRETITLKFDLDQQQYWAIRIKTRTDDFFEDDTNSEGAGTVAPETSGKGASGKSRDGGGADFLSMLGVGAAPAGAGGMAGGVGGAVPGAPGGVMSDADFMRQRFDQFARMQMMSRAKQVKREGILDEIGPLFEKKFSLDDEESEEAEVQDPLLARTDLPEGVVIETLWVGSAQHGKGAVDIEVSPLGLYEPVAFYLKNEDGDYFTVEWDPITGGAHVARGKQDIAANNTDAFSGLSARKSATEKNR